LSPASERFGREVSVNLVTSSNGSVSAGRGIGTWQLTYLVIAGASPLGYALGSVPFMIARGGVTRAATAFIIAGAALAVFAVGYIAMGQRMRVPGGLNVFVSEGFGATVGAGASYAGLLVYSSATIGSMGLFAVFADQMTRDLLGFSIPWSLWAFALIVLVGLLGVRNIELNAYVLGLSISLEILILLILSAAIMIGKTPEPMSFKPFAPLGGADSYFGIQTTLAVCAFAGIEASVLYSKEARDPARTIRNATYTSLVLMAAIYALVTFAIINAFGETAAQRVAGEQPTSMFFTATHRYLGSWAVKIMEVLTVNSWFAAVLAFHNLSARYIAYMGRERLLPAFLGFVHPRYLSPWNASIVFSLLSVFVIGCFAIANADPFLHLYILGTSPVLVGLPTLEVLASLATIAYFRRTPCNLSVWVRWIAPLAAAIIIGAVGIAIIAQMDVFTGREGFVNVVISCSIPFAMAVGMLRSKLMKGNAAESRAKQPA
jgi:amino acid transporter